MGEVTVTVKTCDVCGSTTGNTGLMEKCLVCGREFGFCCQVRLGNPFHGEVCKACAGRTDVREVLEEFVGAWRDNLHSLRGALRELGTVPMAGEPLGPKREVVLR